MRERALALFALGLAACTTVPPTATPSTSGASTPWPSTPVPSTLASPSPSSSLAPSFDATRARRLTEQLAAFGPRETTSRAYRRAASFVADQFRARGYVVEVQRFDVPAGNVDGVQVAAGETRNVIGRPASFDPGAPHLVVGAHLDTVPDSAGANDNASGVGVMLELARLAAADAPRLPLVFVAFGAEERRRQSPTRSTLFLGAQAYLDAMDRREQRALRGMLNLDMVGNGSDVLVLGGRGFLTAALLAAADRRDIPARPSTVADRFSDHQAFRDAGYPVGWLWAGDHPTLHTPRDTISIVRRRMLERVGVVVWDALQRLRPT